MASLIPYLVFSGNCKEALEFYAKVLNGHITAITTYAESPLEVPSECGNRIFDSDFTAGDIRFKASDDLPEHQVVKGTNISLFISFTSQQDKETVFNALSREGSILFPLDENFGMLKDRFGIQWMLVSDRA